MCIESVHFVNFVCIVVLLAIRQLSQSNEAINSYKQVIDMDENKISLRTLAPFSDLKDPTNTIYDHLPYVKDISLEGINKIQDESGNIVKRWNMDHAAEPYIVDTHELQVKLIEDAAAKAELAAADLAARTPEEELDTTSAVDETSGAPVAAEEFEPKESAPVQKEDVSLLNVSEDDDDFSFLND